MNHDPRYLRSQKKLHEAIIKLAGEYSLDKITITAIATTAGVHRSTVYEHADSAAHLLRQAIHEELDALHAKFAVDGTRNEISLEESIVAVMRYLESREDVFARIADETGGEIRDILRSHFMGSLSLILKNKKMDFPDTRVSISETDIRRFTVYAMAELHVGLYSAMLVMEKPRDPRILVEMIRITTPHWWRWE